MTITHMIAQEAVRYRYRGRGGGGGQVIAYLFRLLYNLIGAWAFAVAGGIVAVCYAVAGLLGKRGPR